MTGSTSSPTVLTTKVIVSESPVVVTGASVSSSSLSAGHGESGVHTGAATQTASASPSLSAAAKNDGLPGGAVAGVAIACLLFGAAVGALLFVLFRRRKNRSVPTYRHEPVEYNSARPRREKNPIVTTAPVTGGVDSYLPQPVEDAAIIGQVSKVSDHLKNHVRAYYHSSPINADDIVGLEEFSHAIALEAPVAKGLLLDPSTRSETICLFLAWVTLSRCDGSRTQTLLPSAISAIVPHSFSRTTSNLVEATLYSKWKVITGTLLTKPPTLAPQTITDTIGEANAVLGPFIRGAVNGEQRLKNLEMVVGRVARMAWTLFTQPGSYRFDFSGSRKSLVAFPALLQIVGDDARVLNPPKVLWEKDIVA